MAGKFVRRERKHKKLARQKADDNAVLPDANADEILPEDQKRLLEKRAQIKADLLKDGPKVSGKKAKRLEKYITTKMRKDENREILAKLAQQKVDTSLFTSTKSLGQGKETKRQALTRALREKNAGLEVDEQAEEMLYEERGETPEAESDESEEETPKAIEAPKKAPAPKTPQIPASVGSGLKRPLDVGDDGRPVLKKRQKRGGVVSKFSIVETEKADDAEEEWGGFSSEGEDGDGKDSGESSGDQSSEEESDEEEEESSEGSDDSDEEMDDDSDSGSKRQSAFKAWAHAQRNQALGYQPVAPSTTALDIPKPDNFTPRPVEQEPLPQELQPTTNLARKAYAVAVTRTPEIQEVRMKLPVVAEEQRIMEMIHNNDIVVVCGSTGSGKTTQVPQFLYEAGYGSPNSDTPGMIGVTQPRRVAAVSMSKRVAQELGDHQDRVAYQIRFEGTTSSKTAVKFMTDGVLLREMAQDFSLKKYSAIIIDEAHERSVNTDILIGMLSRINNIRKGDDKVDPNIKPLKIIIMSATLRVEDMTNNATLFPTPPPVVEVEGRQHPVTIHFTRRTQSDYVDEAYKKILRGHKKLPPGGFLVFLTGQNEIMHLSKKLRAAFGGFTGASAPKVQISATEAPMEVEDIDFGEVEDGDFGEIDDEVDDDGIEDEDDKEFEIEGEEGETGPLKMQVLPLYSLLPTREQMRVFEEPPENTRQIILATNVAETSLTIPGIRYVFDCGRAKERQYDRLSGVQTYEIGWISKASASQRAGRAGRTGPGHCYRLYSSAVYERDLPEFTDPEILRMPVDGVVLQLKSMNLSNVVNFPFPTPPDRMGLRKAEKLLTYLSAITPEGQVTRIGSTMSIFPLSPRFARILLVGHQHDCLPYTIMMVAALSAAEIFVPEHQAIPALAAKGDDEFRTNADMLAEDRQAQIRRAFNAAHKKFCYLDDRADAIKLLQVIGEYAHEPTEQWCESHFVRHKVMKEITQLRGQITELLRANIPAFKNLKYQDKLDAPSDKQVAYLKQMVAAGFIDQVALRADKSPVPPEMGRKPRRAIDVPYIPLSPLGVGHDAEKFVYLHPSSPMSHLSPAECPEWVVYSHLQRATQGDPGKTPKTRMHTLTDVTGGQLASLAKGTPLVSYGKPVKEISSTASTREVWVVPYLRAEGLDRKDSMIGRAKMSLFEGVAVVTGAASGIGRQVAVSFAREGCKRIALLDKDEEGLSETSRRCREANGDTRTFVIEIDNRNEDDVSAGMEYVTEEWGRIDYAVNCAAAYSASKAAILSLTKSDAVDYAKYNIRINCVCPGIIDTPMTSEVSTDDPIIAVAPMKRKGTPQEVADAVLFLCSSKATFIHGAALSVDGGYVIN
ncbi:putative ATP-dependent RNA helicase [Colletotrichum sp. SAR 10_70]|nr:putative ATP-dependent RNA helicase [Colletotrichum sp. SAR 10_70]KAI8166837.1 putative ATP-dependent RNA helicase [Colletotrichum sp. SAR 10_71]